ncbi:MAG TPA: RelA/SpoT domain-containing protein [Sphingomonas sp.]
MGWTKREYEPEIYNAAARTLAKTAFPVDTAEGLSALGIINNWRASHSYPLNIFQFTLRRKARRFERDAIVAQRIKRLESIHAKLARQKSMRMTQMQDIAGCRAVLKKMTNVQKLVQLYRKSEFDHVLKGEKDYIANPKPDGYRCHHLVFQYKGTGKTAVFDDLQVEVQIRTQMQHAWATAVEAVGIFTRQALKSNQGTPDWLRFFALMGSAIAAMEGCNPVPGTPVAKSELVDEIAYLVDKLKVLDTLSVYNLSISYINSAKDAKYYLLSLDPVSGAIQVWRYKALQSEAANAKYTELESALPEDARTQIVLVSAENVTALKRAYPNYFLDTALFSSLVTRVLKGEFPEPRPHQLTLDAPEQTQL